MSDQAVARKPDGARGRLGSYSYEWGAPEYLIFQVENVHAGRDSELAADVFARSTMPSSPGLIHHGRLSLSSTRSRSELARHLERRTPSRGLDWDGLIEIATLLAADAYTQGDPPVNLRDATRPPDAGYLLRPIVLGGLPTIWHGDGGSGKSYLALAAALSINEGTALMGPEPASKLRVGYLDWEMRAWEHRERAQSLLGREPDLMYLKCRQAIWDELPRIERFVVAENIGFLVVDSVGFACAGLPIESSEAPLRFFDALGRMNVGSLCVAHKVKDPTASDDYPFGSVMWRNSARLTWLVKGESDPDGGAIRISMRQTKSNVGPLEFPVGFALHFEGDRTRIERFSAEPESVRGRVYRELVKVGMLSVGDLAERTGDNQNAIKQALRRGEGTVFTKLYRTRTPESPDGPVLWAVLAKTPYLKPIEGTKTGPYRGRVPLYPEKENDDRSLRATPPDPIDLPMLKAAQEAFGEEPSDHGAGDPDGSTHGHNGDESPESGDGEPS